IQREKMAVVPEARGREAITHWEKLEDYGVAALLRCQLETGRTHQIRVHLASQGHPIAGDDKYGDFEWNKTLQKQSLRRMFLHAWRLQFNHPATGQRMALQAELPADLQHHLFHVQLPTPTI
ncbi:MAG: RluA family pseudouridine synthase, partial [Limnohabitans sp.]